MKLKPGFISNVLADGAKYEGQIFNELRNGKGAYFYKNGDAYIGDWKNDLFNG